MSMEDILYAIICGLFAVGTVGTIVLIIRVAYPERFHNRRQQIRYTGHRNEEDGDGR